MTMTDRLETFFREHPGQWLDGRELAKHGGVYGWRSRVTDVRRRGLNIENRQRAVRAVGGVLVARVSEYRFVPGSLLDLAGTTPAAGAGRGARFEQDAETTTAIAARDAAAAR
jgi:hypothetical protein